MVKFSYAINSYLKTASIIVEYANPLVLALNKVITFICGYLIPAIPLPSIKIERDCEKTTLREYYGDLQQVFHIFVHCPVFEWCCRKTDTRFIEISYNEARGAFRDKDLKFWLKDEEIGSNLTLSI